MAKSILRMDSNFKDFLSVKYLPSDTETAIENGHVVALAGLTNERDVFKGVTPTANGEVVIVAGVEVNTDESTRKNARLDAFENPAGIAFRAINPKNSVGKIFSVSKDAIDSFSASTAKGQFVEVIADTKLKQVSSLGTSKFAGEIIDLETVAGTQFAVIQIVKA